MQLWAAWACRELFTQAALQWALMPSEWERPWATLSQNWGRHLGPPQCHPAMGWGAAPLPGAGPGVKGNLLPENLVACERPWVSGPHTGSGLDLTAMDATHSLTQGFPHRPCFLTHSFAHSVFLGGQFSHTLLHRKIPIHVSRSNPDTASIRKLALIALIVLGFPTPTCPLQAAALAHGWFSCPEQLPDLP